MAKCKWYNLFWELKKLLLEWDLDLSSVVSSLCNTLAVNGLFKKYIVFPKKSVTIE